MSARVGGRRPVSLGPLIASCAAAVAARTRPLRPRSVLSPTHDLDTSLIVSGLRLHNCSVHITDVIYVYVLMVRG